ncbi:MAG: metal ABC transporter ATP-binding protein [Treponema sp.]|jgi:zinc transport system ATP-binding protein|nr:metal ABC transporter ATP-binding protein [Treponema sp.]
MNGHQAIHPVDREIAVRFDAVSFAYGMEKVLESASFHIHRGEFVVLAGPNGSGKTTVLKLLLGLEQPAAGKIELFGAEPKNSSRTAGRNRIGYVPQQPPADQSFPITVRDVVRMGLLHPSRRYSASGMAAVDAALEQTGIAFLAARSWRALSGGQRRRVLGARALAACPEILVLDEPTANMDEESETLLFDTLGRLKGKTTILVVTHDTEFVSALTDRVLCLGDNEHTRLGIVQHRTEAAEGSGHRKGASHGARILHRKNIPADDCYE